MGALFRSLLRRSLSYLLLLWVIPQPISHKLLPELEAGVLQGLYKRTSAPITLSPARPCRIIRNRLISAHTARTPRNICGLLRQRFRIISTWLLAPTNTILPNRLSTVTEAAIVLEKVYGGAFIALPERTPMLLNSTLHVRTLSVYIAQKARMYTKAQHIRLTKPFTASTGRLTP